MSMMVVTVQERCTCRWLRLKLCCACATTTPHMSSSSLLTKRETVVDDSQARIVASSLALCRRLNHWRSRVLSATATIYYPGPRIDIVQFGPFNEYRMYLSCIFGISSIYGEFMGSVSVKFCLNSRQLPRVSKRSERDACGRRSCLEF